MDKFSHSDNICLNRRDLFDTLQNMIYSNVHKLIGGIYNYDNLKIICGSSQVGLLTTTDFQVTASSDRKSIIIAPGVATYDSTSLIYNGTAQSIDVTGLSNGAWYVHAKYKQVRSLTNKEIPLPVKGHINTESLYTMLTDSCELVVDVNATMPNAILLAAVGISNGLVAQSNNGFLSNSIYMDEVNVPFPETTQVTLGTWATSMRALGYLVYKVNNEYLGVDANWQITERGKFNTVVEHHLPNDVYSICSIVDLRQLSILRMRGSGTADTMFDSGVAMIAGVPRSIVTRHVRKHPAPPVISVTNSPIIWVNRSSSMNMVTGNILNIYYALQTADINISNLRAEIENVTYRMLNADEEEMINLTAEMERYQGDLINALNMQHTLMTTLSNEEISAYMRNNQNQFSLTVNIAPGSGQHEGIVQYEAEVVRCPVSSIASPDAIREYYYSERKYPTAYSDSGDPIYGNGEPGLLFAVRVPINVGDKVAIKIRAIDDNNVKGGYSQTLVYEFTSFNDSEYVTFQSIYDMMVPEFMTSYLVMKEYIGYIKKVWDGMSSIDNQIQQNQNKITDIIGGLNMATRTIDTLYPLTNLLPWIPQIIALCNVPSPPPPPAPPHPHPGYSPVVIEPDGDIVVYRSKWADTDK